MTELDMARLCQLAEKFGYSPATTDPDDVERHRNHLRGKTSGEMIF